MFLNLGVFQGQRDRGFLLLFYELSRAISRMPKTLLCSKDAWAYREAGISLARIFIINTSGELRPQHTHTLQTS